MTVFVLLKVALIWSKRVYPLHCFVYEEIITYKENKLKNVKTSVTDTLLLQSCLPADNLNSKEHAKKVNNLWLQGWEDIQFPNRLTLHCYYFGPQKNLTNDIQTEENFLYSTAGFIFWNFSSNACGVGREFEKGAQKCRGS